MKLHSARGLARVGAIVAILLGVLPVSAGVAQAQAPPQRVVSLTFNDGFVSQYTHARWVQMLFHEVCFLASANYSTCMAEYRPVDSRVLNQFLVWLRTSPLPAISVKTVRQVMGA